jgi:predicted kinase
VQLLRFLSNTVKQREKCVKAATALIEEGTSVVIGMYLRNRNHTRRLTRYLDNTNADTETRAVWVKLAQKLNVPIRCVLFTATAKLCEHNDTVRALNIGPEVSFSTLHATCKNTRVTSPLLNGYTTPMRQSDSATNAHESCDETEELRC